MSEDCHDSNNVEFDRHPANTKPYSTVWAVLSVDKNGNEGICAVNTPIGPQAAITGEERMLDIYLQVIGTSQAKSELFGTGLKIVIAEFTRTKTTQFEGTK